VPATNYGDKVMLQSVLGAVSYSAPATVYVALSTTLPSQSPANNWNFTEPSGGYTRVAVANTTSSWVAAPVGAGFAVSNASSIVFPVANESWGTVVAVGLFDAGSGGNLLFFTTLSRALYIEAESQVSIPPGNLVVSNT